jgi:hypothetical protein
MGWGRGTTQSPVLFLPTNLGMVQAILLVVLEYREAVPQWEEESDGSRCGKTIFVEWAGWCREVEDRAESNAGEQ